MDHISAEAEKMFETSMYVLFPLVFLFLFCFLSSGLFLFLYVSKSLSMLCWFLMYIFVVFVNIIYCLFSDGYIDLDLDNCGGKMFLRVLLNLSMHDYKPLVSGALQLLFRHFSQRQEVLQAFKQVGHIKYNPKRT